MARTTPEQVIALAQMAEGTNVIGYIETATSIVNEIETCSGLGADRLELIERYLAAHFAFLAGVPTGASVASKSIGGASTSYNRPAVGDGVLASPYGATAIQLDTSRCLSGVLIGTVGIQWLGKART